VVLSKNHLTSIRRGLPRNLLGKFENIRFSNHIIGKRRSAFLPKHFNAPSACLGGCLLRFGSIGY
jgi:hypothetical protein